MEARCRGVTPLRRHEGTVPSLGALAKMVTRSHFISDKREQSLKASALLAGVDPSECRQHTDMSSDMECLYVKWEEGGPVRGRFKFVRQSFTNAILDQDQHWHDRPIVPNILADGAFERMFQ